MLFSTPIFLFLFLPIVLGLYYLLPQKGKNVLLLVASLGFYTFGEKELVLIMLTSVVVDYGCGILIEEGKRKLGLYFSLGVNLGLLFFFKYTEFTLENYFFLLETLGIASEGMEQIPNIALPLGISFYTFQTLSYTIDVYWGKVKANRNLIDFATYVTLFPQLIAGPIVRYRQIAGQLAYRKYSHKQFAEGIERFIIGLAKKVILADSLRRIVALAFDSPISELSMGLAWIGGAAFMLQLYFDFAAYSDMAIGLGKMFGFELPENFNYPYISKSVQELWQRWHITLSRWFRDYVYFPLRKTTWGRNKGNISIIILFVLIGIWHGANWTFVIFGLSQGVIIVLERYVFKKRKRKPFKVFAHLYFVWVGIMCLSLFRAQNGAYAWDFYKTLYGFGKGGWDGVFPYLNPELCLIFGLSIIFSLPTYHYVKKFLAQQSEGKPFMQTVFKICFQLFLMALFFLTVSYVSSQTYNPFFYFRF